MSFWGKHFLCQISHVLCKSSVVWFNALKFMNVYERSYIIEDNAPKLAGTLFSWWFPWPLTQQYSYWEKLFFYPLLMVSEVFNCNSLDYFLNIAAVEEQFLFVLGVCHKRSYWYLLILGSTFISNRGGRTERAAEFLKSNSKLGGKS